jgi:hypothetical protein
VKREEQSVIFNDSTVQRFNGSTVQHPDRGCLRLAESRRPSYYLPQHKKQLYL